MTLNQNITLLKVFINRYGWVLIKTDQYFEHYENHSNLKIRIPLIADDPDFPRMMEIALRKLIRNNNDLKSLPIISSLFSQLKNVRQKYSKKKENWILSEPHAKYNINEIPDIYIPKKYIIDKG